MYVDNKTPLGKTAYQKEITHWYDILSIVESYQKSKWLLLSDIIETDFRMKKSLMQPRFLKFGNTCGHSAIWNDCLCSILEITMGSSHFLCHFNKVSWDFLSNLYLWASFDCCFHRSRNEYMWIIHLFFWRHLEPIEKLPFCFLYLDFQWWARRRNRDTLLGVAYT